MARVFQGGFASIGVLAAHSFSNIVSEGAALVLIGGLFTLGALRTVAWAWKEQRDAALGKIGDLEARVQVLTIENTRLSAKVDTFAGEREHLDALASKTHKEHEAMLSALRGIKEAIVANTTALEFHIKQGFPSGS